MCLKNRIKQDGLVLVKDVFTRQEIDQIRKDIRQYFETSWVECDCGKVQSNGAVNCDFLEWVFYHPKLVSAMKDIVGNDVVFTGNCDIHQNKLGNWHKDSDFFGSPPFGPVDNPVFKIGIYLQDEKQPKRVLQFRTGSHRFNNLTEGELRAVNSSMGDVVIFDLRVTHCGMLPTICEKMIWRASKFISTVEKEHPIGRFVKNMYWKVCGVNAREAVFFTFGPNNSATEAFAKNIVVAQHGPLSSKALLRASLVAKLNEQGVAVSRVVNPMNMESAKNGHAESAEVVV